MPFDMILNFKTYIAMGPLKGNASNKLSDGYVPFERTNSNMCIIILSVSGGGQMAK